MTTEHKPPSRTAEQFVVRLPEGMRERIATFAKENGRSMNAEIVHRLERSLDMVEEVAGNRALKLAEERKAHLELINTIDRAVKSDDADVPDRGLLLQLRAHHVELVDELDREMMAVLLEIARPKGSKEKKPRRKLDTD